MITDQNYIRDIHPSDVDFKLSVEHSAVVSITPGLAMRMVQHNSNNRPLSSAIVKRYAEIMRQERWHLNGETVKFSKEGKLLDGQHRLQAVLETGITVKMFVTRGLDKESFKTIDIGRKRTGADAIGIHFGGDWTKHRTTLATAGRFISCFSEHGVYKGFSAGRKFTVEHDDLLVLLEKHKGLLRSAEFVSSLQDAKKIIPVSLMCALHYLFAQKDQDAAEEYFHALNKGANLGENHPIAQLRRRLFFMRQTGGKARSLDLLPMAVKAWELLREGREVSNLRISDDYIPVIK